MDSIQILLVIVIISLTVLLFILGIHVFLVILEVKKALKRLNLILDDALLGAGGLMRPEKLSALVDLLKNHKKHDKKD